MPITHSQVEKLSGASGKSVVLGVRPEDVHLDPSGPLRGPIETILPVGSDQYLGVKCAEQQLFFRVAKGEAFRLGDQIGFSANPAQIQLFDTATGLTLLHGD